MPFASRRVIVSSCLAACRSAWRRIYRVRARGSFPSLRTKTPGDALDYEGTGRAFLLGGHFLLTGSLSITCLFCESFEQTWANMLGLPEPFGP
jgi:hypothetical protein